MYPKCIVDAFKKPFAFLWHITNACILQPLGKYLPKMYILLSSDVSMIGLRKLACEQKIIFNISAGNFGTLPFCALLGFI